MLKGEKPNFPLRIFITSRNVPDMLRLYRPLQLTMSLLSIEIPVTHSMHDIDCYIRSRIENLSLHSTADRDELASNLLRRSNANFLWVRLVLDELEKVYSNESMLQVLQGIPEGMIPYYERTTRAMADNKLEKHIAKAILVWVVASSRKMNKMELGNALRLDINTVLPDVKVAVEGLCGQLISVDENTDLVDVIHATAREFLLSEAAGEFMISKPRANERIALACVKILSSNEMHPPRRGSNRRPAAQDRPDPSPFLEYALTQFSEHVYNASSETDAILLAMDRFLRTNVLSWIEKISSKGDLHVLIRTSKNLRAYLDRRAKYRSPLSNQVKNIDGWSIDLSRLVTKFGAALCQNPSSIYFLIPPLCPSGSAIYQQFGKRPDGLAVVGFKSETWDDCIASVSFEEDTPVAVSCGENLIAVGMSSGNISLYNQQTCQKQGVLRNKFPVDIIHFADRCVVTCTIKSIVLQDLQGNTLWESRLRFRCILLTSSGKSIFAVSQHGHVLKWDMEDGTLQSDESFEYRNHGVDSDYNQLTSRAPAVASISPDMEILALGYRGGTVCLWDLQNGEFIGWARDGEDRLAARMLFNPNPNVNLLLVIYTNHDLFLFETWSGGMVISQKPPHDSGVLSASCSPDGRTLVTTDTRGNLQIWDFGSLTLLYNLESPFAPLRVLDFTSDGLSIVDVTHSGMRIWSPAALIRENIEDDASISDMASHLSVTKAQYEPLRSSRITAICSHPSLPVVFAGDYNGQVKAFSTKNGDQLSELYTHPQKDRVNRIAVSTSNIIASSDSNGFIQVWQLSSGRPPVPKPDLLLLQIQSRAPVKQLCFSCLGDYLLIASTRSDQVYSVKDGLCVGAIHFESHERKIWRWLPMPFQASSQAAGEEFGLFVDHVFKKFTAQKFPSVVDDIEIRLRYELSDGEVETNIDSLALHAATQTLVLDLRHDSRYVSSSTMLLFDFSQKVPSSPPADLTPLYRTPFKFSEHFIGISKASKSFVMYSNSWLSSVDLLGLAGSTYSQHFFVPNEYLPGRRDTHDVQTLITAEDDIVFCLYGELVIVKNGLKFQETKKLDLGR
jgi:WD40 repeat protein